MSVPSLGQHVDFEPILIDELNVKSVKIGTEVTIDEKITPELKREGLMREVIRFVQNARKQAGLNVDDRIELSLSTDNDELKSAINEHIDTIKSETLAVMADSVAGGHDEIVKVEGSDLKVVLKKA